MRAVQRHVRRLLNPMSNAVTRWWYVRWLGCLPRRTTLSRATVPIPASAAEMDSRYLPRARAVGLTSTRSPGTWVAPAGQRPGWQWLPEYGASADFAAMPRWVRLWYRTPVIDRYAYEWMWWHGYWLVLSPNAPPPPDAPMREPRRPHPVTG